jgi:hypothetical protein
MTDDRLIAAHLTAALIAQAQAEDGKAKGTAARNAAKLYFDVVDALRAESKNRHKGKPPAGGFTSIIVPRVRP